MRIMKIVLYFAAASFGLWYVIRKSNSEHAVARNATDPQLRRSLRWYNAAMVTLVCGVLLMLGWIVTQDSSPLLHTVLFVLGIAAILAGFVLSGISGWIKGGAITAARQRDSRQP